MRKRRVEKRMGVPQDTKQPWPFFPPTPHQQSATPCHSLGAHSMSSPVCDCTVQSFRLRFPCPSMPCQVWQLAAITWRHGSCYDIHCTVGPPPSHRVLQIGTYLCSSHYPSISLTSVISHTLHTLHPIQCTR